VKTQLYKLLLLTSILQVQINAAEAQIGGIFEQSGSVGEITRETGESILADLDAGIVSMDVVETENGRLKIQFVDDTQVSMTEHTIVEINEYVYDPNPSNSKMALNFAQGTARFATGRLGLVPRENIQIETPTASIGIRGTDFTMTVDELGRSLVILLPDADCDDAKKLEQGCLPSGSITVTNQGGTQILDEAYQAVMVSTMETPPTTPVTIENLDINMIDNMFIVSQPSEVQQAVAEQEAESQGVDLLAFGDLDIDFLEENLLEENIEDLEFSELDIDYLGVDLLANFLDVIDTSLDMDPVGQDKQDTGGPDKITGTLNPGYDPVTMYNTLLDNSEYIWFLRVVDGQGRISIKIPVGGNARIESITEGTPSIICVNDCSSINIFIQQTQG
jgi:hypothetical protein